MTLVQSSATLRSLFSKSAGAVLLLSAACGQTNSPAVAAPAVVDAEQEEEAVLELEGESGTIAQRDSPRKVGDVMIHRFSGSYRGNSVLLREEVISSTSDTLTVEFILHDQGERTHLRVLMAKGSERILRVATVSENKESPATLSLFEEMMQKTAFVPDANEGILSKKSQTCLIGKQEIDCELSEFKVRVGEEEAKLSVARSSDLGRDLSGEVVAVDGTILYHAELLEMRRGSDTPNAPATGVAFKD